MQISQLIETPTSTEWAEPEDLEPEGWPSTSSSLMKKRIATTPAINKS